MKILIHSNGPHVSTGYGVQTALLAERLHADGHDVAVSCTYGQQGQTSKWRGITLYPTGYEMNSNDVIHNHALHHFDGDPLGGWIIPLLDVWCLVNPRLSDFNVAAWCPVDHFPAPPDVLKFFHRTDAIPVAMSRFGENLLAEAGLEPAYVPLAVDTNVYRPTFAIEHHGDQVSSRRLFGLPDQAFVVGMVAMNKGWSRDRKGFNEALRAFGAFWKRHQDAILFMHSEKYGGADGMDLTELAQHAGIPEHAIVWTDQYAYRLGLPGHMMAAAYTAMDVLLSPSHGEGFGVPLIEAQACGTPVIATHFSAQIELADPEYGAAGWTVDGQPEWDPAQHASYVVPFIGDIVAKLEDAYRADLPLLAEKAVGFAAQYDADRVYDSLWRPLLAELAEPATQPAVTRTVMPDRHAVAVLIPVLNRPDNVAPLLDSFHAHTDPADATVYFVCDETDRDELAAIEKAGGTALISTRGSTYAQKVNSGVEQTTEPWLFICGDDVRFHHGWLDAARKLTDQFDVIGTNDTTGAPKNPDVAAGRHADHFFVRRTYVDELGACLDGPGTLAPEAYGHWYTDKEIIGLAKARNVFTPCLESIVEHLHPGYDGNHLSDPTYQLAAESADTDKKTFLSRLPLIEMQRTSRAKIR